MTTSALRSLLVARRGNYCEICVFPRAPLDVHHFLIHRKKGVPELDTEENCALVCRDCHRWVNGHKERVDFLKTQVTRFGKEHMLRWYNNLPEELKIHSDNLWIKIELEGE